MKQEVSKKEEVEVLGPPVGYVDLLDHATTAKHQKEKEEGRTFQKTPLRPSSSGSCSRELYHEFRMFHKKAHYDIDIIEPETHRLFSLGHAIEANLIRDIKSLLSDFIEVRYQQQVLSFSYLEAKSDTKLSQWLEGSLDLVFWSDKWKCVADVKSKKDKFHSYFSTNWDEMTNRLKEMKSVQTISDVAFWVESLSDFLKELGDPFFEANFKQLNLYASSDFLKERGVNHAAIIQYNKNDSRLREIRFKPSDAIAKETISKFQRVVTAVDEDKPELAPKDYVLGSIKCAFCKFKKECWEGEDAQKAFFKTFPKKQWPTDTNRLGKTGQLIDEMLEEYSQMEAGIKVKDSSEQAIVKMLLDKEIGKIRTSSGLVYEVKKLKDSVVLRRSKA
jgi:hypothetical protein